MQKIKAKVQSVRKIKWRQMCGQMDGCMEAIANAVSNIFYSDKVWKMIWGKSGIIGQITEQATCRNNF